MGTFFYGVIAITIIAMLSSFVVFYRLVTSDKSIIADEEHLRGTAVLHEITEISDSTSVTVQCSCGWRTHLTHLRNGFERAAKVGAAKLSHLQ
jgi:hypothetical protein